MHNKDKVIMLRIYSVLTDLHWKLYFSLCPKDFQTPLQWTRVEFEKEKKISLYSSHTAKTIQSVLKYTTFRKPSFSICECILYSFGIRGISIQVGG